MSPGDWASLFFTSSIALSIAAGGFLIAWLRARERAIRAETRLEEHTRQVRPLQSDSSRGELEAIAAEVGRLAEGQEFLVQILDKRNAGPARSTSQPIVP